MSLLTIFIIILVTSIGVYYLYEEGLRVEIKRQNKLKDIETSSREFIATMTERLRKLDKVESKGLNLTSVASDNITCPLCMDVMHGEATRCDKCDTMFHVECLREMGATCSTAGCRSPILLDDSPQLPANWPQFLVNTRKI